MGLEVFQAIRLGEGDLPKDKFDRVRPGGELVASHVSAGQRPGRRAERGRKGGGKWREEGDNKDRQPTKDDKQLNTKYNAKI